MPGDGPADGRDLQSGANGALIEGSEPKERDVVRCVSYLGVSTCEQVEKGEGEDGFSISAQREACARDVRDAGWSFVDEYVDRYESARRADRPARKEMLAPVAEDRDVEAVIVHEIDRLARTMEDHVAIPAML